MLSRSLKALAAALLVGSSAMALAANDGQSHANQLLSDPDYREAWQQVVKKEERLPEWVMNLSGAAEQMNAVTENGDKYLHISCSHGNKLPTWDELVQVKNTFIGEDVQAFQVLPRKEDYVNLMPYCLHLWAKDTDHA